MFKFNNINDAADANIDDFESYLFALFKNKSFTFDTIDSVFDSVNDYISHKKKYYANILTDELGKYFSPELTVCYSLEHSLYYEYDVKLKILDNCKDLIEKEKTTLLTKINDRISLDFTEFSFFLRDLSNSPNCYRYQIYAYNYFYKVINEKINDCNEKINSTYKDLSLYLPDQILIEAKLYEEKFKVLELYKCYIDLLTEKVNIQSDSHKRKTFISEGHDEFYEEEFNNEASQKKIKLHDSVLDLKNYSSKVSNALKRKYSSDDIECNDIDDMDKKKLKFDEDILKKQGSRCVNNYFI